MKLGNVTHIFKDFVKSGYVFGKTFSNFIADKLEMAPNKARVATGAFDTAAGALITYSGAMSFLGTAVGAVTAVGALLTAPLAAAGTIVLAPIFLALATVWTGVGVGLLSSASEKFGIARNNNVADKIRPLASQATGALTQLMARGKKLSTDFSAAMKKQAGTPAKPQRDINFDNNGPRR